MRRSRGRSARARTRCASGRHDFAARGLRLLFVTGDVIEGTVTPRLLERVTPGLAAARREEAGALPTVAEMAGAIAAATTDLSLPSGHMVVVGGSLEGMLAAAGGSGAGGAG